MTASLPFPSLAVSDSVEVLCQVAYKAAKQSGFYHDPHTGQPLDLSNPLIIAGLVATIHGELSEAVEGLRTAARDRHLPHRFAFEVELADALLRLCSLAGACGPDLSGATVEKMTYNRHRIDHTPSARRAAHGKRF